MPTTRGMLDSSPIAPAKPRSTAKTKPQPPPLERAGSTISLPTPPRTQHKRKRAHSRQADGSGCDSDTDGEADVLPAVGAKATDRARKRRKTTLDTIAEELVTAEEDDFWMGSASKKTATTVTVASAVKTEAHAIVAEGTSTVVATPRHNTRGRAPVSPPPSKRQSRPKAQSTIFATALRPPQTPPRRSTRSSSQSQPKIPGPIRDSPDNVFLVKDGADTDASFSPFDSPSLPANPAPDPEPEKPTVNYVLYVHTS
jgi:hypothetical protein